MPAKRQFCPRGHDTFIVGRNKQGMCRECKRIERKRRYWGSPQAERQARAEDQRTERAILKEERQRMIVKSAAAAIAARLTDHPGDFEGAAVAALRTLPTAGKPYLSHLHGIKL